MAAFCIILENPNKGTVINKPNGPNVYEGINIDYKGEQVTPENFLKVLKGDTTAPGPVLQSTAQDNVFINFVDHGGPGIIAFPSELLSSSDLMGALKYMDTNNMYKNLLFYLEACESGSMFQGVLPPTMNIYATTAADATHSSYACYYDQTLNTYLGDVYSVNWMENSDLGMLATETLSQQYNIVKKETNTSTVCEFGDTKMKADKLNQFQAGSSAGASPMSEVVMAPPAPRAPITDAVDSRQVDVAILRQRLAAAGSMQEREPIVAQLAVETAKRSAGRQQFAAIVSRVAGEALVEKHMSTRVSLRDYSCVEQATQAFHDRCFNLGQESWALEHTMAFASLCADGVAAADIVAAVQAECGYKRMQLAPTMMELNLN